MTRRARRKDDDAGYLSKRDSTVLHGSLSHVYIGLRELPQGTAVRIEIYPTAAGAYKYVYTVKVIPVMDALFFIMSECMDCSETPSEVKWEALLEYVNVP